MTPGMNGVPNQTDGSRRDFLRKLIAGAAFAPPLLASFSLNGLSLTAAEGSVALPFCFNFSSESQYVDNFTDILRSTDIDAGTDLAGDNHPSLNITGQTGSGGSTWATMVAGPSVANVLLRADVLIHRFDNRKGVGFLALAFALPGGKGLALVISNAGNTDRLELMTVDTAGKVLPLATQSLGAGIAEDAWYHLTMQIQQPGCDQGVCSIRVKGQVFRHTDPGNPNSGLGLQVGPTLDVPLKFALAGPVSGGVGIVARAVSSFVDSSVTNFCGEEVIPA